MIPRRSVLTFPAFAGMLALTACKKTETREAAVYEISDDFENWRAVKPGIGEWQHARFARVRVGETVRIVGRMLDV